MMNGEAVGPGEEEVVVTTGSGEEAEVTTTNDEGDQVELPTDDGEAPSDDPADGDRDELDAAESDLDQKALDSVDDPQDAPQDSEDDGQEGVAGEKAKQEAILQSVIGFTNLLDVYAAIDAAAESPEQAAEIKERIKEQLLELSDLGEEDGEDEDNDDDTDQGDGTGESQEEKKKKEDSRYDRILAKFCDLNEGSSLATLLQFIANPVDTRGRDSEKLKFGEEEGAEVIPLPLFRDKFKEVNNVAGALARSARKINENWAEKNNERLHDLLDGNVDKKEVKALLLNMFEELFVKSGTSDENKKNFKLHFASELMKENKKQILNKPSFDFFIEHMLDKGKKLDTFWNIPA